MRHGASILICVLCCVANLKAGVVLTMPPPPPKIPSASIVHTTVHQSPPKQVAVQGVTALDRFAYAEPAQDRAGMRLPTTAYQAMVRSQQPVWGNPWSMNWGWWGSPIVINQYPCSGPHHRMRPIRSCSESVVFGFGW